MTFKIFGLPGPIKLSSHLYYLPLVCSIAENYLQLFYQECLSLSMPRRQTNKQTDNEYINLECQLKCHLLCETLLSPCRQN